MRSAARDARTGLHRVGHLSEEFEHRVLRQESLLATTAAEHRSEVAAITVLHNDIYFGVVAIYDSIVVPVTQTGAESANHGDLNAARNPS